MSLWRTDEFESARSEILSRIEVNRATWPRRKKRVQGEATSPRNWIRWGRKGWRMVIIARATLLGLRSVRRLIRFRGLLPMAGALWGLWRVRRILSVNLPSPSHGVAGPPAVQSSAGLHLHPPTAERS